MTHDEVRDALPLFVVDADDQATRRELLDHLAGCDECRHALQEYQQAADALAQSVHRMPTPAPAPATRAGWAAGLAAAAALVAAAATAGLFQTRAELSEMRSTLAVWQARVADAERNAQASQATLVTYRRQLDVMTADDLLLVSLSGLPPANAAQAKAFVCRSQNAILFTARDLPSLPAARVYQRWAVAGGQAISAGTFVPDARGRSQLVADVPALTARPDALAVTVEPEGGVPAPTGPKYLLGVPAAN